MQRIATYSSPLGEIILRSDGQALTGLWFQGQKHFPDLTGLPQQNDAAPFADVRRWLDGYFAGKRIAPPSIRLAGTAFQQSVWMRLCEIPYGRTTTYGALATQLECPRAVRAVANAVGRNPISLIVPCHRVLGKDGSLTGYAAGIAVKQALLCLETNGHLPQSQ